MSQVETVDFQASSLAGLPQCCHRLPSHIFVNAQSDLHLVVDVVWIGAIMLVRGYLLRSDINKTQVEFA